MSDHDTHDHTGVPGVGDAAVTDATIATTDITTNNASTSKHGWLKKLSNVSTEFMNGQGNWAAPSGGGGSPDEYEAFLTGNVTCVNANTAYDGPTLSLPAGSYEVTASASLTSANATPTHQVIQIYDGTSVKATAAGYHGGGAGGQQHLSCTARVTLAGMTTVKLQAISIRGSSDTVIVATEIANGTTNKATSLHAIKVNPI